MPGAAIAEYGIGLFAVAGVVYIATLLIKNKGNSKAGGLAEVIRNNTKAINSLTTLLQVSLTRQETKIDELLERARKK